LHQALLQHSFDDALPYLVEGLAAALAPAVVQVWMADALPHAGGQGRIGGQELAPTLRLCAQAYTASQVGDERASNPASAPIPADSSSSRHALPAQGGDPLVEEVTASRRPIILYDADAQALAGERMRLLLATPPAGVAEGVSTSSSATSTHSLALGTLAGYP